MPTNSSCTWWVLSHPANVDDWLLAYYGMDINCLKSNRQSAQCYGHCVFSVSKEYRTKLPARLLSRPNPGKKILKFFLKKSIKNYRLDMAGPTGPFATALEWRERKRPMFETVANGDSNPVSRARSRSGPGVEKNIPARISVFPVLS